MRSQQIDEESTIRIVSNKQMRSGVESFMHKESNDDVMKSKSADQSDDQIIWFLFFFEKINQLYHVIIVSSYHLNFYHCIASSTYLSTLESVDWEVQSQVEALHTLTRFQCEEERRRSLWADWVVERRKSEWLNKKWRVWCFVESSISDEWCWKRLMNACWNV
jgi:hypothetical protein